MALRDRPQVIIGTPGRILDLLEREVLDLNHIKTIVLDEADHMLDIGYFFFLIYYLFNFNMFKQLICTVNEIKLSI